MGRSEFAELPRETSKPRQSCEYLALAKNNKSVWVEITTVRRGAGFFILRTLRSDEEREFLREGADLLVTA